MGDTPRHLRLVHNPSRKEHFEQGTGKPKVSPFHPAWGSVPMEERLRDERVAEEPKPQLKLISGGAGGGKKPPKKPTKTGDDGWEDKPEKKGKPMENAEKSYKKDSTNKTSKKKNDDWDDSAYEDGYGK